MSGLRAAWRTFERDCRYLTPATTLATFLSGPSAFALGMLIIFPARYWG